LPGAHVGRRRRALCPPGGHGALGEIEGDSHAELLTPLENLAVELDYRVAWVPQIAGCARGLCNRRTRTIEVLESLAPNHQVSVLVHELCHALVGEKGELAAIDYALEEIVVESATYVALAAAGLQTDVDSVPYVAGWAGDQDPLQVVAQAAALIDELARLIEDAIAPADVDEHEEPDVHGAETTGAAESSAA
jgi:hypothetical protein